MESQQDEDGEDKHVTCETHTSHFLQSSISFGIGCEDLLNKLLSPLGDGN